MSAAAFFVLAAACSTDGQQTPAEAELRFGGAVAAERSLSAMSAPAVVVEATELAAQLRDDGIVEVEMAVGSVWYVDLHRPEVTAPEVGSLTAWALPATSGGIGVELPSIVDSLEGRSAVVLLGYFAEYAAEHESRPGPYSILEVFELSGGELRGLGQSSAARMESDLATLRSADGRDDRLLLVAFAEELSSIEWAIDGDVGVPPTPLLDALVPPMAQEDVWDQTPVHLRDLFVAPESIRAGYVERLVVIDIDGDAQFADYRLGILTDAGWAGATDLGLGVDAAWPVLLDPSSSLRVALTGPTYDGTNPILLAEMGAADWLGAEAIHIVITREVLEAALTGEQLLDFTVASAISDAQARELIAGQDHGIFIPAEGPNVLDESEIEGGR